MLKFSKCEAHVQRQDVRPPSEFFATLQAARSQFISCAGRMSWQIGSFCLGQRSVSLRTEFAAQHVRSKATKKERNILAPI